jgi:methylated-DNA-[protein]-cysteine S-methyltransferase
MTWRCRKSVAKLILKDVAMFAFKQVAHLDGSLVVKTVDSPVGLLTLIASNTELIGLLFANRRETLCRSDEFGRLKTKRDHSVLKAAERQLGDYFSGKRRVFDLPLGLYGTPFQKQVWTHLLEIPFGRTASYGEIAERLGDSRKARPVGGAVGSNPLGIIVPCHRVMGKDGSLTGFGGGLDVKTYLLKIEGLRLIA